MTRVLVNLIVNGAQRLRDIDRTDSNFRVAARMIALLRIDATLRCRRRLQDLSHARVDHMLFIWHRFSCKFPIRCSSNLTG
jgi:hypothetical protein